jgi:TolB-like protein/AraC-like DNA-binding protein/tetratricopeptide (TPR) repeat protein
MNSGLYGNKDLISKLTEITLSKMGEDSFGGKELSRESGLTISILNRRLQSISNKNVNQFIREIRLLKAMELIRNEALTVSEVAYKVGFGSPAYFSTCFSNYFGYPPGEVKKRILNDPEEIGDHVVPEPVVLPQFQESVEIKQIKRKIQLDRILILGGAIVLFLFILIFFYVNDVFNLTKTGKGNITTGLEKSIAVLPFINDSPDSTNLYFINGIMTAILDHLAKIKDLKVVSRGTVEQYRGINSKSIPQIAKELNVSYIVEGSGEKYGNHIKLSIQMIESATDKHLLSRQYTGSLDDIFSLESEVAIDIASKIKAVITQEEKELIEKQPPTSAAAMTMYNMGIELHTASAMRNDRELDRKAESFFRKAIEIDSTFSSAYVQLGFMINYRNPDSAFFLVNKAIHFNPRDPNAYYFLGGCLYRKSSIIEAEDAYKKAIKYKPDYPSSYRGLANVYNHQCKFPEVIKNLLKAQGLENITIQKIYGTRLIANKLFDLGFIGEGLVYAKELLQFDNDSTTYFHGLVSGNLMQGEYNLAHHEALKIRFSDPRLGDASDFDLLKTSMYLRDYKTGLKWIQKYIEKLNQTGRTLNANASLGYVYLKNGMEKEGNWHFDRVISFYLKILEKDEPFSSAQACNHLMYSWSGKGEKAKSIEYLHKLEKYKDFVLHAADLLRLKNDPVYDCIRSEQDFQEFIIEMEDRFETVRLKIEKILREEAILVQK